MFHCIPIGLHVCICLSMLHNFIIIAMQCGEPIDKKKENLGNASAHNENYRV